MKIPVVVSALAVTSVVPSQAQVPSSSTWYPTDTWYPTTSPWPTITSFPATSFPTTSSSTTSDTNSPSPSQSSSAQPTTTTSQSMDPTLSFTPNPTSSSSSSSPSPTSSTSPSVASTPICPDGTVHLAVELYNTPMDLCCTSGGGMFAPIGSSFNFQDCTVAPYAPPVGLVYLYLRTDAQPSETSFSLMDIYTGDMLWEVYDGKPNQAPLLALTDYRFEIAVDGSSCFLFTMEDSGGDGLTALNGVFELYFNGELVLVGQNFGSETSIVVGDAC